MRSDERHKLGTDEFVLQVDRAVDWAQGNRRLLLTLVAGIVGASLLVGGLLVNRANRKEAARTRLGMLTAEIQTAFGGDEALGEPCATVRAELEGLVESEGGSQEGRTAAYYLGICDRAGGDLEAARVRFEAARARRDLIGDLAALALAGVQRRAGDTEEAALTYRTLLDGNTGIPVESVLFELGVLEEEAGRPEAAVALYDRIVEEHPGSSFLDLAETRRERLVPSSP